MNVLIRPLIVEDASVSYKWRNDPEIWKFTGSKPKIKITEKIEREWIKNALADITKSRFAILVDNEYVGNIQLTNIELNETAEFHIFIGNKIFWGKGIAKEATYQILTYAKEVLGLKRIFLDVKKENLAALKSYQKNNFFIIEDTKNLIRMVCEVNKIAEPTLSIFCMVYNHEKYISKCLDGFLMQKTNFSTLIVLGEDCSTDNSREIIKNYAQKYPGKFKLLLHDENIGAHQNQNYILNHCKGKYIALCEGDDYWTDSDKLQKQVDFLENNQDYSICFTDYEVFHMGGKNYEFPKLSERFKIKNTFSKHDIILNNFIPTLTVVYRNRPEILCYLSEDLYPGDWFIHVLNSKYGKIKFLSFVSAVYRKHDGGVCSSSDPILNNFKYLKSIEIFRKQFKSDYVMQLLFMAAKWKIYFHSIKYKIKKIIKPI